MRTIRLSIALVLFATSAYAQKGVAFTASADHATLVTKYQVRIDQNETQKVLKDIGKPTPDSTNTITYLDSTLFSGLADGDYKLYAIAVGDGGVGYSQGVTFTVATTVPPAPPGDPTPIPNDPANEVVLYTANAGAQTTTRWSFVPDVTAASGATAYLQNGLSKATGVTVPAQNYLDVPFTAKAGVPYHVWLRMKADSDNYTNDSVFVQFSGAQDANGATLAAIGTTNAQVFILEEGSGANVLGWGWNDASYGGLAPNIYFKADGAQTIRIVRREDGLKIDQIVISPSIYLSKRPGLTKNDTNIIPRP